MSEKTIFRFGLFVLGTIVLALTYYYANIHTPHLPDDTSPTVTTTDEQKKENNDVGDITEDFEQAFIRDGLKTNSAIRSIDLKLVLGGGPGKDGIPSIDSPTFTNIANADSTITDETLGLYVKAGGVEKFYPYNVLVWHEIVNDVVGGTPLVVTFCPLCGSAIVFDATYDGEAHDFGVSGKLYDSNLLMYDRDTESLWSQIIGEAVVGDETGKKLTI